MPPPQTSAKFLALDIMVNETTAINHSVTFIVEVVITETEIQALRAEDLIATPIATINHVISISVIDITIVTDIDINAAK